MKKAIMLAIVASLLSPAAPAIVQAQTSSRSADACEGTTGRARSRCLQRQRQESRRQEEPSQPTRQPRSSPTPEAPRVTVAQPARPAGATPGDRSAPGPALASRRVTLTWNSVNGATEYDLGVRDVGSDTLVVDTRIVGNSYDARLERGRSYRWNVRACNAQGCSSFTSPLYFSTGDVTAASAPPARGPAAATMVASPNAFPLFNQHDAGNDRLYGSASWASGNDPTLRRPRQRHTLTCLATVYAMLEHGYGRTGYRVGPDTYTDQAGAIQPSSYSVSRHDATGALDEVVRQLYANRPVILHGPIPGDDFGHFILAVGVGPDGRIIAHDPSGGLLVRIDPATRAVTGSNTISTIDGYRIVTP